MSIRAFIFLCIRRKWLIAGVMLFFCLVGMTLHSFQRDAYISHFYFTAGDQTSILWDTMQSLDSQELLTPVITRAHLGDTPQFNPERSTDHSVIARLEDQINTAMHHQSKYDIHTVIFERLQRAIEISYTAEDNLIRINVKTTRKSLSPVIATHLLAQYQKLMRHDFSFPNEIETGSARPVVYVDTTTISAQRYTPPALLYLFTSAVIGFFCALILCIFLDALYLNQRKQRHAA